MISESVEPWWYVRSGNQVRGPYPAEQIARFILQGRVAMMDDVSRDQHHWITTGQMLEGHAQAVEETGPPEPLTRRIPAC